MSCGVDRLACRSIAYVYMFTLQHVERLNVVVKKAGMIEMARHVRGVLLWYP